jgi:hypothetical protein
MIKYLLKLSSLRKTPIGTLMMSEATSSLNNMRKHYWEHEERREKGHEHEQNIRHPLRAR